MAIVTVTWGESTNLKNSIGMTPGKNKRTGYIHVVLSDRGRKLTRTIHTLVADAFLGKCPPGHEVNHIDGVRNNAKLSNLEYVTASENILHAVRAGRWPIGSKRYNSRLTEERVKIILRSPTDYTTVKALAAEFGVTPSTVLKVINRENWKHVTL